MWIRGSRSFTPNIQGQATATTVEGRELISTQTGHGYAMSLQIFQCRRQVEDGLGASTYDYHGRLSQFLQIGTHINAVFGVGVAVYAADSTRGKYLDAKPMSDPHVAATVVAPSIFRDTTTGKSRRLTLRTP